MLPASDSEFAFVYLSSIRKRCYHGRNTLQTRRVPGGLLAVVAQGKGYLYTEHRTISLKAGQFVWLLPGQTIEVLQESDTLEVIFLAVRELALARRKGGWRCSPQSANRRDWPIALNMKPLLGGFERLFEESRSAGVADTGLQMRFQSLLCELYGQPGAHREGGEAASGIDRTLTYMHKHYGEKIKLETLANLVGLTPTSYSRSFKKAKHMTPVEYLNQIRMDSAKRLLEQPGCSVKAAASAVGMGSEFYFSRMFRKTVGLSPTLYIKRRQMKVASASCFRFKDCLHSLGVEDAFELGGYLSSMQSEEGARRVELQLEQMREFQPDIILADARHLSLYERLKEIAPTVVLRLSMDWRGGYMRLAELVGRETEARLTCLQLAARISKARERLSSSIGDKTISMIRLQDGKIRVQGRIDHPLNNLLYAELGLKPGSCVPPDQRLKEVGLESLAAFETDYLFVYDDSAADSRSLTGAAWYHAEGAQRRQTRLIPNWVSMSWAPTGQHQIIDMLEQWEG